MGSKTSVVHFNLLTWYMFVHAVKLFFVDTNAQFLLVFGEPTFAWKRIIKSIVRIIPDPRFQKLDLRFQN